jgi:hypothetical protein
METLTRTREERLAYALKRMYVDSPVKGGLQKNLRRLAPSTGSASWVAKAIHKEGIMLPEGTRRKRTWKWVSTTEPNVKMAESILEKAREYQKQYKAEKDAPQEETAEEAVIMEQPREITAKDALLREIRIMEDKIGEIRSKRNALQKAYQILCGID